MKPVWITCAVLCVCGLICSGGLFVMGRSVIKATSGINASADNYCLKLVRAICPTWDLAALRKEIDPSLSSDLAGSVVAAGKPLGALVSAQPFTASSTSIQEENDVQIRKVTTSDSATFEHGTARITMVVVDSGFGWKVRDFQVTQTSSTESKAR